MKNILYYTASRSGHHAVVNWIQGNFSSRETIRWNACNIIKPLYFNPYITADDKIKSMIHPEPVIKNVR